MHLKAPAFLRTLAIQLGYQTFEGTFSERAPAVSSISAEVRGDTRSARDHDSDAGQAFHVPND